jgi:hypothetical protein
MAQAETVKLDSGSAFPEMELHWLTAVRLRSRRILGAIGWYSLLISATGDRIAVNSWLTFSLVFPISTSAM